MFSRFTACARRSIVLSQEAAREVGHDTIDSGDLVAGLVAEGTGIAALALADLGISEARLREHRAPRHQLSDLLRAAAPPVGGGGANRYLPFTAELKTTLEGAWREALKLEHAELTTGHLLLAVISASCGAGTRTLAALGAEAASARAAVHRQFDLAGCDEAASRSSMAMAVVQLQFGPAPKLPDKLSLVLGLVGRLAWYAATAGLLAMLTSDRLGSELVATTLIALPVLCLLVGLIWTRRTPASLTRRMAADMVLGVTVPDDLVALLARHGITSIEIRMQTDRAVRNRCYRIGRRAWIVLSWKIMVKPGPLRFVLAHEIAHLVRHDSLRRRADNIMLTGLVAGAMVSLDPTVGLIALAGSLLLRLVSSWSSELSCDRIAVRWVGIDDMQEWVAAHRNLASQPQNRTADRRIRQLADLLTHPPHALRLALARSDVGAGPRGSAA